MPPLRGLGVKIKRDDALHKEPGAQYRLVSVNQEAKARFRQVHWLTQRHRATGQEGQDETRGPDSKALLPLPPRTGAPAPLISTITNAAYVPGRISPACSPLRVPHAAPGGCGLPADPAHRAPGSHNLLAGLTLSLKAGATSDASLGPQQRSLPGCPHRTPHSA